MIRYKMKPPTNSSTHATHATLLHPPTQLTIYIYICMYVWPWLISRPFLPPARSLSLSRPLSLTLDLGLELNNMACSLGAVDCHFFAFAMASVEHILQLPHLVAHVLLHCACVCVYVCVWVYVCMFSLSLSSPPLSYPIYGDLLGTCTSHTCCSCEPTSD